MKPPEHENCGLSWYCDGCQREVCSRCQVSPGDASCLCPECWWMEPDGAA